MYGHFSEMEHAVRKMHDGAPVNEIIFDTCLAPLQSCNISWQVLPKHLSGCALKKFGREIGRAEVLILDGATRNFLKDDGNSDHCNNNTVAYRSLNSMRRYTIYKLLLRAAPVLNKVRDYGG